MKTALVLTGHMRDWKKAFPSIKENFIDPYQPDIFISTWDDFGYWVSPDKDDTNRGVNKLSPKISDKEHIDIINTYNITEHLSYSPYIYDVLSSHIRERSKQYEPYCQEIRPQNVISMFYGIYMGISAMEEYSLKTGENYDMVIRTRPDISWSNNFPDFNLANFDNEFYTSHHTNHTGQGTGDMLQIGSSNALSKFKNILFHYDDLTKLHNRFCPHMFTESYIHEIGYDLKELNISKVLTHTPEGQYVNYQPLSEKSND